MYILCLSRKIRSKIILTLFILHSRGDVFSTVFQNRFQINFITNIHVCIVMKLIKYEHNIMMGMELTIISEVNYDKKLNYDPSNCPTFMMII